jgi:predicted transcriptional regulator
MKTPKRATIYLDPELHRALRMKAAVAETSVSYLVNEAVRQSLSEDEEDLAASRAREKEAGLDFEQALVDLRRRGKL